MSAPLARKMNLIIWKNWIQKLGNGIKKNKLLVVPVHKENYADSSKTTFQEAPGYKDLPYSPHTAEGMQSYMQKS